MPLVKRMFASSEQAWEPTASSSINFCRKRAPYHVSHSCHHLWHAYHLTQHLHHGGALLHGVCNFDCAWQLWDVLGTLDVTRGVKGENGKWEGPCERESAHARERAVGSQACCRSHPQPIRHTICTLERNTQGLSPKRGTHSTDSAAHSTRTPFVLWRPESAFWSAPTWPGGSTATWLDR
jgi:hypothetical protein